MFCLREIVLEPIATKKLDEYRKNIKRFNDLFLSLEWLLAKNPTPINSVPSGYGGLQWRVIRSQRDKLANSPELWMVYYFNETQIIIIDMHVIG